MDFVLWGWTEMKRKKVLNNKNLFRHLCIRKFNYKNFSSTSYFSFASPFTSLCKKYISLAKIRIDKQYLIEFNSSFQCVGWLFLDANTIRQLDKWKIGKSFFFKLWNGSWIKRELNYNNQTGQGFQEISWRGSKRSAQLLQPKTKEASPLTFSENLQDNVIISCRQKIFFPSCVTTIAVQ